MIVLVTGASGFIGRPLVGRLLASGHTLRILTRNASVTQAFHWPAGGPFPDAALEGVEAVLHLAGENIGVWPWTTARKRRILDSRVLGTRALVEAMGRQSKPPRIFVSASAMGYYGQTGTLLCNEVRAPGQGFLAEVVHAWEAEIFKAQALGIRTVAVRNGLVLGIGYDGSGPAGALGKMLPSFRLGLGAILGTGKQYWSWIHLEDSVQIFMHALANANVVGALNACAPEPVTQAEFSRSLALALGRPRWLRVPAFALKMGLGSMADTLLEGQRGDPGKLLASGYRFQYTSLAQALKALLAAEHPGRKEGDTHAGE